MIKLNYKLVSTARTFNHEIFLCVRGIQQYVTHIHSHTHTGESDESEINIFVLTLNFFFWIASELIWLQCIVLQSLNKQYTS